MYVIVNCTLQYYFNDLFSGRTVEKCSFLNFFSDGYTLRIGHFILAPFLMILYKTSLLTITIATSAQFLSCAHVFGRIRVIFQCFRNLKRTVRLLKAYAIAMVC